MSLKNWLGLATIVVPVLVGFFWLGSLSERIDELDPEQIAKYVKQLEAAADTLPIGTIIASTIEPAGMAKLGPKWRLADGNAVESDWGYKGIRLDLDQATAALPDLTDVFLRGMRIGRRVGERQDYATALPRTPFQVTMTAAGNHFHTVKRDSGSTKKGTGGLRSHTKESVVQPTSPAASHMHSVTLQGGDSETRPANAAVYFYIKVN